MSTIGISRDVLLTLSPSKSFSQYNSTLLVNLRKFVGKFFSANECKQTCRCPAIRNYEMRNSIGRASQSDSTDFSIRKSEKSGFFWKLLKTVI